MTAPQEKVKKLERDGRPGGIPACLYPFSSYLATKKMRKK
jgi:hypothetical protein